MSYTISIWQNPPGQAVPGDVPQALKLLSELSEKTVGVNPGFVELVRELTQRFPKLDDLPMDEEADEPSLEDWLWSGGDPNGYTDRAVLVLGVDAGRLGEFWPFLLERAHKHGLCVFDEQTGEIFNPAAGPWAPPVAQTPPAAPSDGTWTELPKAKELKQAMFDGIAELMTANGYKGKRGSCKFVRKFAEGWSEVEIGTAASWPLVAYDIAVYMIVRIDAITDLEYRILEPELPAKELAEKLSAGSGPHRWMDKIDLERHRDFISSSGAYDISDQRTLACAIAHLTTQLKVKLLPALKEVETLGGFERAINPPDAEFGYFDKKTLFGTIGGKCTNVIAAYLAGNPRLVEMCDKYQSMTNLSSYEEMMKCIDYVRAHPR